jgi:hypothetical protein
LQRKYSAGQQTVVNALKLLDKNKKLVRIPRKKIKVTVKAPIYSTSKLWENSQFPWISSSQSTDTVLAMHHEQTAIWQPIVNKFNQKNSRHIQISACDDLNKITAPNSQLKCDFVLFGANPIHLGIVRNTSLFMDMQELTKEINQDKIFSSAFIRDPQKRMWGIAPNLTPVVIFRNRQVDSSQCLNDTCDWNWTDFKQYAERVKQANPELSYVCSFYGYMDFLFNNGVSLIEQIDKISLNIVQGIMKNNTDEQLKQAINNKIEYLRVKNNNNSIENGKAILASFQKSIRLLVMGVDVGPSVSSLLNMLDNTTLNQRFLQAIVE